MGKLITTEYTDALTEPLVPAPVISQTLQKEVSKPQDHNKLTKLTYLSSYGNFQYDNKQKNIYFPYIHVNLNIVRSLRDNTFNLSHENIMSQNRQFEDAKHS